MELNKKFEDLNWDDQTIDGNELKDIQGIDIRTCNLKTFEQCIANLQSRE